MSCEIDVRRACSLVERLHEAVNRHDADAIAALCSDDVVWEDPAASELLHGRDAVRWFHREVMFRALPDVAVQLIGGPYLTCDGTEVAVRLRIIGTMTGPLNPPGFAPTGRPIEFETAEFSQWRGGLLARHTVVMDMLGLARQIGAAPRAGSWVERIGIRLQHLSARWARKR
jgi:predicted ester cyclase